MKFDRNDLPVGTPVVGMVGELPDPARAPGLALADGDRIVLIGPFAPSLAGSELAKLRGELAMGLPGNDIAPVADALAFVREQTRSGSVGAAHDVSANWYPSDFRTLTRARAE